jgi:hypothetical protein
MNLLWDRPAGARALVGAVIAGLALLIDWNLRNVETPAPMREMPMADRLDLCATEIKARVIKGDPKGALDRWKHEGRDEQTWQMLHVALIVAARNEHVATEADVQAAENADSMDAVYDLFKRLARKARGEKVPVKVVRHGDVEVALDQLDWSNFNSEALILAARVTIRNDGNSTFRHSGIGMHSDTADGGGVFGQIDVARHVHSLRRAYPEVLADVAPGDSATGWFLRAFDHRPSGGTPGFDLVIEDLARNQFVLHVEQTTPAQYVSDEAAKKRVLLPPSVP